MRFGQKLQDNLVLASLVSPVSPFPVRRVRCLRPVRFQRSFFFKQGVLLATTPHRICLFLNPFAMSLHNFRMAAAPAVSGSNVGAGLRFVFLLICLLFAQLSYGSRPWRHRLDRRFWASLQDFFVVEWICLAFADSSYGSCPCRSSRSSLLGFGTRFLWFSINLIVFAQVWYGSRPCRDRLDRRCLASTLGFIFFE